MNCDNNNTPQTNAPSLLIVDDDELFCSVLTKALANKGYAVSAALNLDNAHKILNETGVQYAIVDLCIGQESGLKLVQEIKENYPDTRIVVLTGYASIATAVEAIKLGAIHYLTKPTTTDEIINALNNNKGDMDVTPAPRRVSVKRLEWEHLQNVLMENGGNISAAARALGMHRRTLQRKLSKKPTRE